MPWMIMEERFDGTSPGRVDDGAAARATTEDDRKATIARLSAEVRALKNRKVVRAANLIGRAARQVRRGCVGDCCRRTAETAARSGLLYNVSGLVALAVDVWRTARVA